MTRHGQLVLVTYNNPDYTLPDTNIENSATILNKKQTNVATLEILWSCKLPSPTSMLSQQQDIPNLNSFNIEWGSVGSVECIFVKDCLNHCTHVWEHTNTQWSKEASKILCCKFESHLGRSHLSNWIVLLYYYVTVTIFILLE